MNAATPLKLTLTVALLLGSASTAFAQDYQANPNDPAYQQQVQQYQDQQQDYQKRQQDYQDRATDYQAKRDAYSVQRDRYSDDKAAYERQRADYDARYGSGAWDRQYGYSYHRDSDDYRTYADNPCERRASGGAVTGGVIGALAGAAIGSSIAGRGDRGEGAVLGAVAGGALGAGIGASAAACDDRGYYFSYDQTVPYRETSFYDGRYSGRYDYDRYQRMHCRLAVAPAYTDGVAQDRYVRVCPDSDGRYRITG